MEVLAQIWNFIYKRIAVSFLCHLGKLVMIILGSILIVYLLCRLSWVIII
jgi:hypothetical protein